MFAGRRIVVGFYGNPCGQAVWAPRNGGLTPANTLSATIRREIKTKGDTSRFVMAEGGKFVLTNKFPKRLRDEPPKNSGFSHIGPLKSCLLWYILCVYEN